MAKTHERSIAKRAASKRARTHLQVQKAQMDVHSGGVHCHWKDWENKSYTGQDGYHDHVFVVGGKLVRTDWGGQHRHPIMENGAVGSQLQPHTHDIFIGDELYVVEPGGAHNHTEGWDKDMPDMMLPGGEHRHTVEIDGVTYESITPNDVLSVNIRKGLNLGIQSLILSKDRFLTFEKASQKAEVLGLELKKFEEREEAFVFIQRDHGKFKELSLQTITLEDGVDAVIGVLNEDAGEPDVTLTPQAVIQPPKMNGQTKPEAEEQPPAAKVEIEMPNGVEIEIEAFDQVQQAQVLGYVTMSEEQASSLKNLKDEFAGQVKALKTVIDVIASPVTEFIDKWIEKASENHATAALLDRVNTELVLMADALSEVNLGVEVGIEKSLQEELAKVENNDQLAFALRTLNDVLVPVMKIFEDTSFERFHQLCKATHLSTSLLVKKNLSIEKALIPMDDMAREELKIAQEARSKKWGIEIVAGSALTFPSGFPTDLNDYGDPVNLKFPFDTEERAANARVRFKQFANDIYSKEDSKMVVHNRIVAKELEFGINVTIDENDPLDMLLSDHFWEAEGVNIVSEKSESDVEKNWFVPILKASEEERTVFGIVLEPNVTDLHKDTYDEDAVIKAAHHFMENMQNIGKNHTQIINGDVKILESYVAPVDMSLETPAGKVKIKKNTWLMKVRIIAEDIWQQVKKGELTGFSIGALAQVTSLEEE